MVPSSLVSTGGSWKKPSAYHGKCEDQDIIRYPPIFFFLPGLSKTSRTVLINDQNLDIPSTPSANLVNWPDRREEGHIANFVLHRAHHVWGHIPQSRPIPLTHRPNHMCSNQTCVPALWPLEHIWSLREGTERQNSRLSASEILSIG